MTDSQRLLVNYVRTGSEPAFRELLARYVDLVYSAAVRLVDGDTHLAQDVTQTVFVDLARKARRLPKDIMLGGWLHHHTVFVASTLMRGERRRHIREREAVEMNALQDDPKVNLTQLAPILDDAIDQLGAEDRTAILLRYFERNDFRSVGEALGSTEEAARKRVGRALEKLHSLLQHRGVSLSTAALGTALATEAVSAAPTGLAASIAGTALAGAVASGAGSTLFETLAMTKLKLSIISAIAVAGVATPLLVQHNSLIKLRRENQTLRQQMEHLDQQLATENEPSAKARSDAEQPIAQEQLRELLRLRGEVGVLRRQLAEGATTRQRNAQAPQPQSQDSPEDPQRQLAMAKLNYPKQWMLALILYAEQNQGQCPTNFDQAASFLPNQAKGETNLAPDQFEIVYQGSLNDLSNRQGLIVIREKEAWQSADGGWFRAYGFADGHSELHKAIDGDFGPWEDQHRQQALGLQHGPQ